MFIKISEFFFLIGCLFLFSFNDFPLLIGLFLLFDAAVRDASFPFFTLAAFFSGLNIIFNYEKFPLCKNEVYFLFLVILLIFLSAIININFYDEICNDKFCSTQRIISSSISTAIRFVILLLFLPIIRHLSILRLLKYIKIGFYFTFLYVILELIDRVIPFYLNFNSLGFIDLIQPYFHDRLDYDLYRSRGFAFEPSFQALYLIAILPFLVVLNSKCILLFWLICFCAAQSSTALLGLATFIYFYYNSINLKNNFLLLVIVIFLSIIIYIFIKYSDFQMTSTLTRVGSWYAAIVGISNNLFFGVGASMSGFWVSQFYPDFFNLSFESERWRFVAINDFAAPTFASILTFVFDFGILLFLFIIYFLKRNKYLDDIKNSKLATASFFSLIAASFGMNTYAFWGYWLFLAITMARKWPELDSIRFLKLTHKSYQLK